MGITKQIAYRGLGKMAKLAGVTHSHLRRVIKGERRAGPQLAKKMKRLGIALDAESTN